MVRSISKTRKVYLLRLVGRIVVFLLTMMVYIFDKSKFDIAQGIGFFKGFSVIHILWIIWVADMIQQLLPVKTYISIGSQKVFESLFRPIKEKINYENLRAYIRNTTISAYKVMIIWVVLTALISALYVAGIMDSGLMVLTATFFYVCDLICVLIWCPFRLIIKNKCCTTCRIFNWDHLMMFLPVVALNSIFSWSLVLLAFAIWLVWEICVLVYPERFWENSNMALRCSECTDKLCIQYCKKIRK